MGCLPVILAIALVALTMVYPILGGVLGGGFIVVAALLSFGKIHSSVIGVVLQIPPIYVPQESATYELDESGQRVLIATTSTVLSNARFPRTQRYFLALLDLAAGMFLLVLAYDAIVVPVGSEEWAVRQAEHTLQQEEPRP